MVHHRKASSWLAGLTRMASVAPFVLLLAACGGGDGPGPAGINPPPSQLVSITETNALVVAGVAAEQALSNGIFATLTNSGLPVIGAGNNAGVQLAGLARQAPLPGTALASVVQACNVSGSVDVDVSVANPNSITVGDRFTFVFDDCDNGTATVLNGGLAMTIDSISGDPNSSQFLIGVGLDLDAFTAAGDGDVVGASGMLDIEIDATSPMTTIITVSAATFTVTGDGETQTFTGLEVVISESTVTFPPAITVSTTFGLASPRLGGDIVVTTTIGLASSGSDFPYAGEITVSGDRNSSVTLIALDSNLVRLEVDTDGDGAVDVVIDTTWLELLEAASAP